MVTIDMLPDLALLEIFHFYIHDLRTRAWWTLVHVCQKWRNIVFQSPRRLDLRLHCGVSTPVRETLDVWPPLPISISAYDPENWVGDNIIAALEHNDRISEFQFSFVPSAEIYKVLASMLKPFPALTRLELVLRGTYEGLLVSASFLGGSAPRLRTLILDRIPFLGLTNLLLSAVQLVHLQLWNIPHLGYFSPEAMVTCLSVLTRLECLDIRFKSARSHPNRRRNSRRPAPQTRILLPFLAEFGFSGSSEYSEVLVARIDAPLLDKLGIIFFHEQIFDTPQLSQFIARTPKFNSVDEAHVVFSYYQVLIRLPQPFDGDLYLAVRYTGQNWLLSCTAQLYRLSFPWSLISTVERLYIFETVISNPVCQNYIDSHHWLELLDPFTTVKDLYISWEVLPRITPALQELVGERVTEVLPALRNLFLEKTLPSGTVQEGIQQFIDARQRAIYPVDISCWDRTWLKWGY